MQRLRITFSRCEELKYLSHLDLMRLWERALRRADIPLMYSQGYSPHPRISIAAPLPIGVTSDRELMDVLLRKRLSPYTFINQVREQLPSGIDLIDVIQVALQLPSLQSQVRKSEYCVELETNKNRREIEDRLSSFMARENFPWQHRREHEVRQYDIRALVDRLWIIEWNGSSCSIGMCLRSDSSATGRAEQVALALDFPSPPASIHRTKLILAGR